ncbi:pectinesterase 3 [Quercus suber]|uniref:Pectinesterase n=1 Tax=Quercus suber TaxID=58331 RepID=A0AAW0LVG5_QUESU
MDSSIKSFQGYGKVDEIEEQAFKKKTRRRLIIVIIPSIVLLALVIVPATEVTPAALLKAVCSVTQFPNSCFSSISSLETANTTDPKVLFKLSLHEINVTAHVTMAKDGSGDYTSISEVVEAMPKKSSKMRFVIYVKEGKYVENVVMDKSKWNVMMYGDGKDKTIVSSGLNFVDEFLATKFESTTEYISITKKKKTLFLALFATLLSHNNSSHNEISAAAHAIHKNSCSSILCPDFCYSAIATVLGATAQLASKRDVIEKSQNLTT